MRHRDLKFQGGFASHELLYILCILCFGIIVGNVIGRVGILYPLFLVLMFFLPAVFGGLNAATFNTSLPTR